MVGINPSFISGMFFIIPCLDDFVKADLRTVTFDVPPQEVGMKLDYIYKMTDWLKAI